MAPPEPDQQPAAGDEFSAMFAAAGLPCAERATSRDRGLGPYRRLLLRGATVIDGTGAPPWGPADIVVEDGRITVLKAVGTPGMAVNPARRPAAGDHEIDCTGKFVTPGFVDCHAHIGAPFHAENGPMPSADYVYKLWLAHGVTTVRETGCFNGLSWTLEQKRASAENRIAAPRIFAYAPFPGTNDYVKTIHTPEAARAWIENVKERAADGIKFFGAPPTLMRAALEECARTGMRSCCHHAQLAVGRMNALTTAQWGLTSSEHSYGLPEALLERRTVQDFPQGYDYRDEYLRFSAAGQTFLQAAKPGSAKWEAVLAAFLESGHSFVPTFNVYDGNRDLMRTRRADWHERYTDPTLWAYFQPQRGGHGAYWYRWSTTNEVEWRETFRLWMAFVNAYKNLGGRVGVGSDSGFMYQVYGFGYVRELELLQEAGFHPLEVLRAATLHGAELLGVGDEIGTLETGKRADILVHDRNPLDDFKLLYGTGAMRLEDGTTEVTWPRCLSATIKDGIVYDPAELLADVAGMVEARKAANGATP
ncbi:amidohydrolase family protein [Methylobacterium oryzae]|uniref:amidohydrolase family protein n=1 Tax=Methylobacterium oryzae TaxID=334852 RepID=UPI001F25605A|nr:amidohydrolase family protein [Methylobacterium oryzae]UIN36902.1 amidohydrolase family protein [Methylobacterium oryzae]